MTIRNIRLAYLASGSGSSVEELATKITDGKLEGFISSLIICNNPPSKAGIFERAKRLGIPIIESSEPDHQLELLRSNGIDLVLGLGYIKKIEENILDEFEDRVLNIHPTLLPKHGGPGFYGLKTHMSVLESGDNYTGATVHLMNEEFDKGEILRQIRVPVPRHLIGRPSEENAKKLQQYVLQEEYRLMPQVLEEIRDGRLETGFKY